MHLVYGCEKATECGIAAFDNPHRGEQPAELHFRNLGEAWRSFAGTLYGWEHTDDAETKVGPRDQDMRELRGSPGERLRNQTLFIQTINATLQKEDWKRLTGDSTPMDVSMDSRPSESSSAGSISPGPSFVSADLSSQSQHYTTPPNARKVSGVQCCSSVEVCHPFTVR